MLIRGKKLSQLIDRVSFSDAVFLLLRERLPKRIESRLFSAILTSIIDHGMGTTSSLTTRFVVSGGNALNAAVGAGVLAIGDYHGGAIENAMKQMVSIIKNVSRSKKLFRNQNKKKYISQLAQDFVSRQLKRGGILYGFGHKIYKTKDPRSEHVVRLCKKLGFTSDYIVLGREIERSLEDIKGVRLCFNIDGVIAALLLEMGFDPCVGKGIFIIGRTAGLVAQAVEEKKNEKPVRRIEEKDISYIAPNKS